HVFNAGYGLGGSAMHHYAVWPRFHPEDFQLRSRYDRALDWPLGYGELQAYYDQIQSEAGIAGDAQQEIWRPPGEPYPLPPVPLFAQGEIIARGFERLGMHTAPLPLAVTTRSYKDRAVCIWDGWCDAGCPIGALANPLTIHLPVAKKHGAIVLTDVTVSRILTTDNGEFATGVEYRGSNGETSRLMADLVVLAAFTIQNPRLLLASATPRHPSGLANSSGTLGTCVMTHSAAMVYGLFDETTDCHRGATGGQLVNQDGYDKLTHAEAGAFGSYQWMIAQAVKPNALLGIAISRPDLFGHDLHTFIQSAAHHFASMTAVMEDLPVAENAVTLDHRRDRFGIPLARVTHTSHAQSKALWQAGLAEGQTIFKAAGANEVWAGPQGPMHIMGGTIMGTDPANSVCNEYGQTHDISNLVVAGAGLFPTSAGVNPTFTILALAARSSEYLLNHWNSVIP
ncbi:MAG: GMC family oxidoreductase, partial [Mariprofundaceae bacterium]|nr:GMC family oxidoreductase [Mariprofundaceae bacterium]